MYKIAVVGDKESILGFSAIGMDIYPIYDENELKELIPKLIENEYAIIYITENIYIESKEFIEKVNKNKIPAIVTIPRTSKNEKIGQKRIKDMVTKAIGMEIKFKD